jgi:hypothetical protein
MPAIRITASEHCPLALRRLRRWLVAPPLRGFLPPEGQACLGAARRAALLSLMSLRHTAARNAWC